MGVHDQPRSRPGRASRRRSGNSRIVTSTSPRSCSAPRRRRRRAPGDPQCPCFLASISAPAASAPASMTPTRASCSPNGKRRRRRPIRSPAGPSRTRRTGGGRLSSLCAPHSKRRAAAPSRASRSRRPPPLWSSPIATASRCVRRSCGWTAAPPRNRPPRKRSSIRCWPTAAAATPSNGWCPRRCGSPLTSPTSIGAPR